MLLNAVLIYGIITWFTKSSKEEKGPKALELALLTTIGLTIIFYTVYGLTGGLWGLVASLLAAVIWVFIAFVKIGKFPWVLSLISAICLFVFNLGFQLILHPIPKKEVKTQSKNADAMPSALMISTNASR